jgi:hypothetical protein
MVAMPAFMAACGFGNAAGWPSHTISPSSGRCAPAENLDERGLSGAVLAEQAVHLAGAHLELDAVERAHAGERSSRRR